MNSLRSPALFRTILCDTSAELAALNSSELPDGATVYDNQAEALYRLDKFAGTTFDSLIGSGLVVKPADQTVARWIEESVVGGSPYYYSSYLNGVATVAIADSNWTVLGNTAASFLRSNGSAAAYTLDAETSKVTYNGPPVLALVRAQFTMHNADGATLLDIAFCLSKNGDVVPGTTTEHDSLGELAVDMSDSQVAVSTERIVLLNPGTTLQLALRNRTNTDDISVGYYQLSILPL